MSIDKSSGSTQEPQKKCRVLQVLGRMARGGAELRILEVMRQLVPEGIVSDVLVLSGQAGELDSEVERCGGTVIPLMRKWGWQQRLRKILRAGRYSAVHSHVHYFSGWILKAAYQEGVPVRVAQFHNIDDGNGQGIFRQVYRWRAKKLLSRYATSLLGVSHSALSANWPKHQSDSRCQVIYNGVDFAPFFCSRSTKEKRKELLGTNHANLKMVIHVGNLTPAKNHAMILQIFIFLARQREDVHLFLVGGGEMEREVDLRRQITSSPFASRIHVLGIRTDVPTLLLAADAFIFPSLYEGLPGALVEACAAGLPCVTSDIGPCREVSECIPLVHCLSINQTSEIWASELSARLDSNQRLTPKESCRLLTNAGFDVAGSSARYAALWQGRRH